MSDHAIPAVSDEALVRVGLTAAGVQAASGRGPGEEPAIFFVAKDPGIATLVLRAAGNGASALLAELERGSRVEVRLLGPVEVGAPSTSASWRRVLIEPAGPVLLVPPGGDP